MQHPITNMASYNSLVLKAAWAPTRRFLKDLRVDIGLILVGAAVAIYQHRGQEDFTWTDAVTAALWGLLAAAVLIALVFIWNLLRAPHGVYAAMKSALEAENRRLEEELAKKNLRQAGLPLGTELRDIRHKIEIVMSTRPHPQYSHGFRLPGARWDEYDAFLAKDWPDLYTVIERAYTLAHHVNEALDMRETRAGAGKTLGVIADDGLAEAYEAAGVALDALGEPRGEPWETKAQTAVRTVTEDILREWEEKQQDPSAVR